MIIILRTQIIRLILGSGHFGWDQTVITANTLGYFSLSLVFTGLAPLFSRGFYALHNTKIPMIVTLINVVISVALGKILSMKMGVEGLALGFSIGAAVGAISLFVILRMKTDLKSQGVLWFILRVILAAILMVLAMQEVKVILAVFVDMHRFWGVATQTLISLVTGTLVYLLSCWIFGLQEIDSIKLVWAKFTRRGLNGTNGQ